MANSPPLPREGLQETLQFRPKWWWDPVPWWIFEHLRPEIVRELATIHMEFEKQVLEAQLNGINRAMETIGRMK